MFWFNFNGHCYKYVGGRLTWAEAERNCVSQGANLASIRSHREKDSVRKVIQNSDPEMGATWIGLRDVHMDGWWMWSDGSEVSFTEWGVGFPNNANGNQHCGHVYV